MGASTKTNQNSVSKYTPTAQAAGLYTNVINQAQAAQSPYDPNTAKTVAGLNDTQNQAFGQIGTNQGIWQPNVNAGAQQVAQAGQGISAGDISKFYNPYENDVIGATLQQSGEQDAMQNRAYTANEAAQGGLGGSGFHIGRAQLQGDQAQARNNTIANLRSTGFNTALSAAQADKSRGIQAGTAQAGIGQLMSQLGYGDANAQLTAGNQQQAQQQNVNDTASQNAINKQLFPMQQAQWLGSLASGIGPLTGGTTASNGDATTSQGKGIGNIIGGGLTLASMASDERVKENEREIGRTHDGQPIYKFNYTGDPRTQIGLMAQDVERGQHPEAVDEGPGGVKMVNYDQALQGSYADGGGIGGLPAGLLGWADLKPAQVKFPDAPNISAPSAGGSESAPDYAAMGKGLGNLGKMAGFGMPSQLPSASSPAGGALAASGLQDGARAGGFGGGLSGLMGMFGFADGGLVASPEEMQALEMQESGGRDIVNPKSGAFGPRQLMPATARDPGFGVRPLDAAGGLGEQRRFSDDYFNAMLTRYGGDRDAARVAYNGGPKRADNWLKAGRDDSVIPAESANYYKQIAGRMGEPAAALVAKGQGASSEAGEGYSGKADKATGGFLKRAFGVDFNPLGLNENERRALMVAGLSMLSNGDVGKGGLAGMQYLTGAEAGEREAGTKKSALDYQMRKDADDLALRTRAENRQESKDTADQAWRAGDVDRKNAELTGDQKEYAEAKKDGYAGTFTEFQRAQHASRAAAPESVREWETAKGQGFEGGLQDWLKWKSGNKPLTATDKNAIIEADEYQNVGNDAIEALKKAVTLNDKGYTGPLASSRGYATSIVGSEGGKATQEIENLVQTQAVAQLKKIFGGQPTEGERQILLDLQGSVAAEPSVRKGIWERGIKAAQRRLDIAKDQSEGIRSGTYFKPGGNKSQQSGARPTATGPDGKKMEYDGKAWVPAQ